MESGYIKLWRSIDNWDWRHDPNTFSVFLFCLTHARHAQGSWQGNELFPGQLITSHDSISKATGITVRSVRTALNRLKKSGNVTTKATNRFTVVTIENWSYWQSNDNKIDKQTDRQMTSTRQADDKQVTTNKNEKNEENDKNTTFISGDDKFNTFWAAYPRKIGKDAARKAFAKRSVTKELLQQMLDAIEAQKRSEQWQKNGGQFIPHPATWINQGRWEDETEQLPFADAPAVRWVTDEEDLYD